MCIRKVVICKVSSVFFPKSIVLNLIHVLMSLSIFQGEEMRYLLCPAAMTVGLVKKFIRLKFELDPKYKVKKP